MTFWYWTIGLVMAFAVVAYLLKKRRDKRRRSNDSETYPFW